MAWISYKQFTAGVLALTLLAGVEYDRRKGSPIGNRIKQIFSGPDTTSQKGKIIITLKRQVPDTFKRLPIISEYIIDGYQGPNSLEKEVSDTGRAFLSCFNDFSEEYNAMIGLHNNKINLIPTYDAIPNVTNDHVKRATRDVDSDQGVVNSRFFEYVDRKRLNNIMILIEGYKNVVDVLRDHNDRNLPDDDDFLLTRYMNHPKVEMVMDHPVMKHIKYVLENSMADVVENKSAPEPLRDLAESNIATFLYSTDLMNNRAIHISERVR
ncbi:hypothetical protein CL622_07850 [archaeon]|nr:hypothetical protein [archaeon]|tara:strand:- start:56 stop:856 length:801 start_codon:yes stop_codon:yes gene_type:complete